VRVATRVAPLVLFAGALALLAATLMRVAAAGWRVLIRAQDAKRAFVPRRFSAPARSRARGVPAAAARASPAPARFSTPLREHVAVAAWRILSAARLRSSDVFRENGETG
jgi:hypothetical protein